MGSIKVMDVIFFFLNQSPSGHGLCRITDLYNSDKDVVEDDSKPVLK